MAKNLAFSAQTCSCGADLSSKKAPVAGMKANVPMGYCPECGIAQPLAKLEAKPEAETANP